MTKTKTIRVKINDAEKIEQAARELGAELKKEVKVSDVIEELMKGLNNAKKGFKENKSIDN
jgi:helix-turn-helix protein